MWIRCLVVFLGVGLLGGCEKEPQEKKVPVKGQVTLDKKPMADGEIAFVTPGNPPEILPITNGSFAGELTTGKKKVEIRAYREEPPPPTATGDVGASRVNYIPAAFNDNSRLEADVKADGPNEFRYDVTSR